MEEPLTDDLLNQLLESPSPDSFLQDQSLVPRDLSTYLQDLLQVKDLKRIDVIHKAGLNETHGYQIFTGSRNASRDKLLRLALAMKLSLTEANRLLQAGGVNGLYAKERRDAIIIFCLTHGYNAMQTDEELYRLEEQTLG